MKTHFIIALEPKHIAQTMTALCGKEIKNPETTVMTDVMRWGLPDFDSLLDCRKCIQLVERQPKNHGERLYIYGIVEGQSARTESVA